MTHEEEMVEEIEDAQSDAIKWISAGFGIGLLVGGIVGLLLAPKPGKESRDQLKSFAGDLSEKTKKLTKDLGGKAKTTKEALSESFKAGKDKYEEFKKQGPEEE